MRLPDSITHRIHVETGALPDVGRGARAIDDSDGGCPGQEKFRAIWTREHLSISIDPTDVISDDGTEIFSYLRQHSLDQVLFVGVHANMCLLNNSFGIKAMVGWGISCYVVRDLTDIVYNPALYPYVSHEDGTDLVIRYIEQHLCPSISSTDLLTALGTDVFFAGVTSVTPGS